MTSVTSSTGTLYVVATPLGNREDITLRALRILREVGLIACEDTRRTARLLEPHGIKTPRTSFFEHNERWKGKRILGVLRSGRDVALVTDAGTPGISDPGFRLVRDARVEGLSVVPIPGPSAATAALSVSGLPTDRFLFVGFMPPRAQGRRRALTQLCQAPETLVLFESPVRAVRCLEDMLEILGDREAFLCREATKLHEEYALERLSAMKRRLEEREAVRGEIVFVVAGASERPEQVAESVEAVFARLSREGRTRREAVKETARLLGLGARDVYQRVLDANTE
jgi:16S rRNA (cytidine1402-2'-O)-methyltransferase